MCDRGGVRPPHHWISNLELLRHGHHRTMHGLSQISEHPCGANLVAPTPDDHTSRIRRTCTVAGRVYVVCSRGAERGLRRGRWDAPRPRGSAGPSADRGVELGQEVPSVASVASCADSLSFVTLIKHNVSFGFAPRSSE